MKNQENDTFSLAHTTWKCQYHIVFTPKYHRKVIYGALRTEIGKILRELCKRKGVEIIEAHAMQDHIHMLVSIPPNERVSSFMGYLKGKSTMIIFERYARLKYKYGNRHFWSRGYYVSTVTYFYGHFSKRRNLIHYSIKPNIPIDIGLVANHLNNLTPATLKLKEMIFDYVENHKNAGHFIVAKFILILKFFFGFSYSQVFHQNGFHGSLIRISERICKIKRVPCKKFLYGSHFLSICGSL